MIDELVWELNQLGYQPAWLPEAGLVPPDVYNLAKVGGARRLVRRGALSHYLPAVAQLTPRRGAFADIEHHQTTKKQLTGAVEFLKRALGCLGVSAPRLDLGFSAGTELTISLADVQFARVDIAAIEPLLPDLRTHAIPDEVIEQGRLHIAYEYLYAGSVRIERADRRAFERSLGARHGELIDVGLGANVTLEQDTRLVFAGKGERAAFAYRAAQLTRTDTQWKLDMTAASRGFSSSGSAPYLPAMPGVVLETADASEADAAPGGEGAGPLTRATPA